MVTIRDLKKEDNASLSKIIKDTLTEFNANYAGTSYDDPVTDTLFEVFQTSRSKYFLIELNGEMVGGAGIYPTDGLPPDTCELVKMYLLPRARGHGLGITLIEKCVEAALDLGFTNIYLETLPELLQAQKLYEKFGFEYINGPMGTGHAGSSLFMLKKLT